VEDASQNFLHWSSSFSDFSPCLLHLSPLWRKEEEYQVVEGGGGIDPVLHPMQPITSVAMSNIIKLPPSGTPSPTTDLIRARLETALGRYAPGTRRAYEMGLRRFAEWVRHWLPVAPAPIGAVFDRLMGNGWWPVVERLMQAGPMVASTVAESYLAQGCASLAPASAALRLAAVKWPFRLAREMGALTWEVHVKAPQVIPYRDVHGPGLGAIKHMLDVARESPDPIGLRDVLILHLLFVLGLRRSELCGLDAGHFEPGEGEGRIFVHGKGRSDREPMTVPGHVASLISRYLDLRGQLQADAPLLASHDRAGKGDGRLTPHGLYQRITWLARGAGIRGRVSPHRIRHSAITAALDRTGGDVRRVRPFARHRKAETTLLYDDRRTDVAGEVAALLAGLIDSEADGNAG
jgi:integrase/recombinase XerC